MPAALPWFALPSAVAHARSTPSLQSVVDALLEDPEEFLGPAVEPPKMPRARARKGKEAAHGGSCEDPTTDHALEETLEGEDVAPVSAPTSDPEVEKEAGASLPAPSRSLCRVVDKRGVVVSEHDGVELALGANTMARMGGRLTRVIRVIDNMPMSQW